MPKCARSYERITRRDLERLARIAEEDLEGYFRRNPGRRALKRRVIAVALCQGAALHYMNGSNGVKDFDVYTFFAGRGVRPYPARVRRVADFGSARFGQSPDRPDFAGRRVDLLGRSLPERVGATARVAIRSYLRNRRSATARFLARKAVVLLRPRRHLGVILWPEV
jgi:hypothetical protein